MSGTIDADVSICLSGLSQYCSHHNLNRILLFLLTVSYKMPHTNSGPLYGNAEPFSCGQQCWSDTQTSLSGLFLTRSHVTRAHFSTNPDVFSRALNASSVAVSGYADFPNCK